MAIFDHVRDVLESNSAAGKTIPPFYERTITKKERPGQRTITGTIPSVTRTP
jgi:hypothetical protein